MPKSLYSLVFLALGALVLSACGGISRGPSAAAPTPIPTVIASIKVVAEGRVTPIKSAALSFPIGGIVNQVAVALGTRVKTGQVLAQLDSRQLEFQLAQAEANLAGAQAKLNQLQRGPTAEDVAAAQQNLASAQAAYDNLLHPSPGDIAVIKADADKSKAALEQAQAAYDRVGGDSNPNAKMLPQREALQSAWLDYQKANTLYTAKLDPSNAQIQHALAAVQTAKDQLAKLQPSADERAGLQAGVNAAKAARDLAAEQFKTTQLVAPFGGTVMALDMEPGGYVAPGAIVLRLADTSSWQIETTDLTELNIVQVSEGTPATMTFDAIPELELSGNVTAIRSYGESKQGDIVYTVIITPHEQDTRLRWNMTAKVSMETK